MEGMRKLATVAVCVLVLVLAGCGGDDEQTSQPQKDGQTQTSDAGGERTTDLPSPAEMAELAEKNRQTLTEMNKGKVIEAVSAGTLKDLLPANLSGMERTDASAERTQTMGIDLTTANAQYNATGDGDAGIHITLTDTGNMSGPMRMGMAAWAMTQYSRETDTGYEKTTTYNGYKALEEYDREAKRGGIRVFVVDRFVVEVEGDNTTIDAIKQALGKIDLKKLAGLASGS